MTKKSSMFISIVLIFFYSGISSQTDNLINEILSSEKDFFGSIINNQEYDIQIIYTQINRDADNNPIFKTYSLNSDHKKYFYPASTVKLPACVFALEKLNEINITGLNANTFLEIDSSYTGQSKVKYDSSTFNNLPTIANYIKKILLVSDNDAFNRLYEFLGQEELNKRLWFHGFKNSKITHRLSIGLSELENRHTNKFRFYNDSGILYEQPAFYSDLKFNFELENSIRGIGYYVDDKLIMKPKDFTKSNYFSLEDQHNFIKILFFGADSSHRDFNLTYSDYKFLYRYMALTPRQSSEPIYPENEYWDGYVKFFIFGNTKERMPDDIRIFNKVGEAYGFLIDNAYIVDFKNKVEFLLSAVIYVNEDEIFNDDKYEYDEIGFPFLARLGKVFYNYELKREKKFLPNLSKLSEAIK